MFPLGFHVRLWGRKHNDLLFCHGCLGSLPEQLPSQPVQELRSIIISENVPKNAILVTPRRPELQNGRLTVFDAADNKLLPSVRVVDKTRLSGRPEASLLGDGTGLKIGLDIHDKMADTDKALTTEEGLAMLQDIRVDA